MFMKAGLFYEAVRTDQVSRIEGNRLSREIAASKFCEKNCRGILGRQGNGEKFPFSEMFREYTSGK